ncbi:rhomboid family intramembrane serine protease [Gordonia sp. HY002]|uniref:rhomboid family intramembrane serine protease n=1 Tax=Gordonia zhenghanii TaxID=2911516 RepID=UPI001EF0D1C5|nr:rhomboid family intramembrane serine protease [Gordonia zhenghanii]MCF8571655.1 rhomboid family intramembrane serine protease [Gordonia zhenghanii]MCF8602677.1 rhomboid family intramembrane serine protease [Gordonia zhenghanii]
MNQVCYRHPDRPTALSCTRCGRSACPECLRPASVGQHCVDCVADANAAQRATGPTVARTDTKPVVTYALIAINVLVFGAVMLQAGGTDVRDLLSSSIYTNGVLVNGSGFDNQYWRLLTSGFLHQSVPHLALNMFSLYIIGADLERVLGRGRYLAIYLVGLLGGSAAIMALQQEPTLTAGASGAIYGLMGALFVILVKLKAPLTTVIVIIVINIVFSVTIPNVSILGHLGGLVFGAASAAVVVWLPGVVLPPAKRTQAAVDRVGWYGLIVLAVLALAVGAGIGLGASV